MASLCPHSQKHPLLVRVKTWTHLDPFSWSFTLPKPIIVRLYNSRIRKFCEHILSNQNNTSLSGGNLVIWLDNNQNVTYLTLAFHPVLKNTSLTGCNTDQLVVLWLYDDVFSTRKPVYTEKMKSLIMCQIWSAGFYSLKSVLLAPCMGAKSS